MNEKRMLMVSTVPSMIGQFNMDNIFILLNMGYKIDVVADFSDTSVWPSDRVLEFKDQMNDLDINCIQLGFSRNPFKIWRHICSYKNLVALIKEKKYTFVHTHTPIASAIARIAAHRTKTKLIYTAHGFHFYDGAPWKNWIIYYPIEKVLSKYTNVLITINREDYTRAEKKFKAQKVVYIPGVGVDTRKFSESTVDRKKKRIEVGLNENDFLLLSVGELSDRKNQKIIIEALGRMKKEGSIGVAKYYAIGKGDKEEYYRKLIKQLGLEKNVALLGYRTDIVELCHAADCFVHPSVREGLGIAPLEAMASGLPLIASKVNGIKDYTEEGVSGCCINPTDVKEMVSAIKRMMNDKSFRLQCGENNIITAANYDISNTERIMRKTYEYISI